MEQTHIGGADFENGIGIVRLVGNLVLNYEKVQLVADIDLATLKGTGHLILIEETDSSQHDNAKSNAINRSEVGVAADINRVEDTALGEPGLQGTSRTLGAKKKIASYRKKTN
jgi:hypothetical protein